MTKTGTYIFGFFLCYASVFCVHAAPQSKAIKSVAAAPKTQTKITNKAPPGDATDPAQISNEAQLQQDVEALQKKSRGDSDHKGFVAFMGPAFLKEIYTFRPLNGSLDRTVNSKSYGFVAGFSLEYEFQWVSGVIDFGVLGASYALSDGLNARGVMLGGLFRPKILARFGGLHVGPTLPLIVRYASLSHQSGGTLLTENFQVYKSFGGHIDYDFGRFRLGLEGSFIDMNKQTPFLNLQTQFEL